MIKLDRQKRTVRSRTMLGIFTIAMITAAWTARSDSLYPADKGKQPAQSSNTIFTNLYGDSRAHGVGDVLTITVTENTSASATATTKTEKDETVNGLSGTGLFNRLFQNLSFSATGATNANGTGTTTRAGQLTTTLSVLVTQVLANGSLRVEGSRIVGINKEAQKVTFSGVVRPEDITTTNTVDSSLIASVEVKYDGKGIVADTQKSGLLTRVFHFLF